MAAANRYYRESGAFSPVGLAKTLVVCFPLAILAGAIYAVIAEYCPLVYITGIVCYFFALWVGKAVGRLLYAAHTRNLLLSSGLAVILAVICEYMSLVVFLHFATNQQFLVTAPDTMVTVLDMVAAQRVITLGKPGRSGGIPIEGMGLKVVWTLEFLIFLWAMVQGTRDELSGKVYCERCSDWVEESLTVVSGPSQDLGALRSALEAAQYHSLEALQDDPDDAGRAMLLGIAQCQSCRGTPFLTAVQLTPGTDDKGNEVINSEVGVSHLEVTSEVIEMLQRRLARQNEAAQKAAEAEAATEAEKAQSSSSGEGE